jgi:hypothetical protein
LESDDGATEKPGQQNNGNAAEPNDVHLKKNIIVIMRAE